jgi:general stress protein 26
VLQSVIKAGNGRSQPSERAHAMTSTTSTNSVAHDAQAREKLWGLIKDIRFSMFTVRHANGHLHSRPMTTQNTSVDEDSSLWFFMSRGSEPVADLARDPNVNVAYADVGADSYVSVAGRAAVVEDLEKKRQLWSKMAQAWFPGGAEDADLALVQVKITHADYWDVKENKLVQLFKMAQAAVTGKPPSGMGEHGEVRMA